MSADREMNWKSREDVREAPLNFPTRRKRWGAELLSHTHAFHAAKEPSPACFGAPVLNTARPGIQNSLKLPRKETKSTLQQAKKTQG